MPRRGRAKRPAARRGAAATLAALLRGGLAEAAPWTANASHVASINNVHASRIVLGQRKTTSASWLGAAQVPQLHAAGLRGRGQVVGLGDTGIDVRSCSFRDDAAEVPYDTVGRGHRKIAAYVTMHGDRQDGPDGHGTHIAGSIASEAGSLGTSGDGIAPGARLALVDLEESSRPGMYNVPDDSIGTAYFDFFRNAGAAVVCSPWSYKDHDALELAVDSYAWEHPEFLPVFPSGNALGSSSDVAPQSPCRAKNALCVGASFNAREAYLAEPSFVSIAVLVGDEGCIGPQRESCAAAEVPALTALFGPTVPEQPEACAIMRDGCLQSRAACPECSFPSSKLGQAADVSVAAALPRDGCRPLVGFPWGAACVVDRGGCSFAQKAHHCAQAGASGAIVVNRADAPDAIMLHDSQADPSLDLSIPTVLVPFGAADTLLAGGRRVTFPTVPRGLSPERRAPYSSFGAMQDGRTRPEIVFPGDNIASTAAAEGCALRRMSGTSQSCGLAAGVAALLREYLQVHADAESGRLPRPWASTLRALLAAAAAPSATDSPTTVLRQEVGFGLPAVAALLPPPFGVSTRLFALQSHVDDGLLQRFCLTVEGAQGPGAVPVEAVLAWTDPPDPSGRLRHDLDLEVSCSGSGWDVQLGNGRSSPDRANTVEKVLLSVTSGMASAGLCVVSVAMRQATPARLQPFSLALAGPFAPAPGCEAPVPLPKPLCGANGVAEVLPGSSGGSPRWRCRCTGPWAGPLCNQIPEEVALAAAAEAERGGGKVLEGRLRPWQWAIFRAAACGAGDYEFVLEHSGAGQLEVLASTSLGAHLWSSSSLIGGTVGQTWSESGIAFSAGGTGDAHRASLSVAVPAAAGGGTGTVELFLAAFARGRSGPFPYTARWRELRPGCAPTASLRGGTASSKPQQGLELGLVILYFSLGLIAILSPIALCVAVKLCMSRRPADLARKACKAPTVVYQREKPLVTEAWQARAASVGAACPPIAAVP